MGTNDVIALILAIYGSLLATVLGVREILKERRNIKIILEYIYFYEKGQITITNIGHRPITITGIGMEKYMEMKGEGHFIKLKPDDIISRELEVSPFPITLKDGEPVTIPLSGNAADAISGSGMMPILEIFDAEGNTHKKYTIRHYDPRTGRYHKMKKEKIIEDV